MLSSHVQKYIVDRNLHNSYVFGFDENALDERPKRSIQNQYGSTMQV